MTKTMTRIEIDEVRSFEIRPGTPRRWVAVLVTRGKPDCRVREFASREEARDAAHKWAQAENEQTAVLRRWQADQRA